MDERRFHEALFTELHGKYGLEYIKFDENIENEIDKAELL